MSSNQKGARVTEQIRVRDRKHVWHPWSPHRLDRSELTLTSAQGCRVHDLEGREYIDCASLNATVGFGRREVVDAIAGQLMRSPGTDISIASHDLVGALAERISGYLPDGMTKTLFVNSGSEAWDAALFVAASYWRNLGEPRTRFIAFARGYHGSTIAARTLTGLPRVSHPFDPPFPVSHVELPFAPREMCTAQAQDCLIEAFDHLITDPVLAPPAAVVVEPLLNVGGGVVLPDGFLAALGDLCRRRGVLLAVDEVFTAYGRCGAMFAINSAGIAPDLLVSSKGLASGYAGIAALTVSDAIHASFDNDDEFPGLRFGHTTSGHAPTCAAALATLDIIEAEGLCAAAARGGDRLRAGLAPRLGLDGITDVRGLGLITIVEMNSFERAAQVVAGARRQGLLIRQPGESVLVCPPLTVSDADLDAIVARLTAAIQAVR